jgi:hypothetical protein
MTKAKQQSVRTDSRAAALPHDGYVFESRDVIRFTRIPATYLNKFLEHNRIRASIRQGEGRGSRRLFTKQDVLGIALMWALFQTGLRSKVIADALRALSPDESSIGPITAVATILDCHPSGAAAELVIRRWLGPPRKKGRDLRVITAPSDVEPRPELSSELVIPVGRIFEEVKKEIERFRATRGA